MYSFILQLRTRIFPVARWRYDRLQVRELNLRSEEGTINRGGFFVPSCPVGGVEELGVFPRKRYVSTFSSMPVGFRECFGGLSRAHLLSSFCGDLRDFVSALVRSVGIEDLFPLGHWMP